MHGGVAPADQAEVEEVLGIAEGAGNGENGLVWRVAVGAASSGAASSGAGGIAVSLGFCQPA